MTHYLVSVDPLLTYRPVGLYIDAMVQNRETQAEATRSKILMLAAEEILKHGFQSTSVGDIIKRAHVSKGCFYHHFSTKQALGYAVLDESLSEVKREIWLPIINSDNALKSVIELFNSPDQLVDCETVKHGCPINNLAQEMSPIDEGFRARIETIYTDWKVHLTNALKQCQKNGHMSDEANPEQIATLIIAVSQGAIGIAKNAQQPSSFTEYTRGLVDYLTSIQS